jgi:hypothetical protein
MSSASPADVKMPPPCRSDEIATLSNVKLGLLKQNSMLSGATELGVANSTVTLLGAQNAAEVYSSTRQTSPFTNRSVACIPHARGHRPARSAGSPTCLSVQLFAPSNRT